VYEFIANDAGTFWYHSHQATSDQLPRGLLGALVVEPRTAQGVVAERDYSLLMHGLPGTFSVAVNGSSKLHLDAAPGETVRLRLISAWQFGEPQTPVLVGAPYVVAA